MSEDDFFFTKAGLALFYRALAVCRTGQGRNSRWPALGQDEFVMQWFAMCRFFELVNISSLFSLFIEVYAHTF